MTDISMKDPNKPFHGCHTNGKFVQSFDTLQEAEEHVQTWNNNARDNGRRERYIAISKPTTPKEEI